MSDKYGVTAKRIKDYAEKIGIDTNVRNMERQRLIAAERKANIDKFDAATEKKVLALLTDLSMPAEDIWRGLGISAPAMRAIAKKHNIDLVERGKLRIKHGYYGTSQKYKSELGETMSKDGSSLLWLSREWK